MVSPDILEGEREKKRGREKRKGERGSESSAAVTKRASHSHSWGKEEGVNNSLLEKRGRGGIRSMMTRERHFVFHHHLSRKGRRGNR